MPTPPLVSVIIPTRNRARVLRRAIESVLRQTIGDLEVLIVDDASEDDTAGVVGAMKDARVRYVRREVHAGAPAARNAGIRAARGHYLAFQDSDDEWLPRKLELQLDAIRRHAPHAGVATCGTETRSNGVAWTSIAPREIQSYAGLLSYREPPWGGQTIVVRRTAATDRVLFDEALPSGQDWDYVVRLARITTVVSVREPLVRIGTGAGGRISVPWRKLDGTTRLREKYDEELRRYPPALVAHELRLCRLHLACGNAPAALRHGVNALIAGPFRPDIVPLLCRCLAEPWIRPVRQQVS